MSAAKKTVGAGVVLCLLVGGCVQTDTLASLPPDAYAAVKSRANLKPAGVSTVEFKEMGDSRRASEVARIIRATWTETCSPASIRPIGYLPTGSSVWLVKCSETQRKIDYQIQIPEKSSGSAQVLQCYPDMPARTHCTIAGRPA